MGLPGSAPRQLERPRTPRRRRCQYSCGSASTRFADEAACVPCHVTALAAFGMLTDDPTENGAAALAVVDEDVEFLLPKELAMLSRK